MTPMVDVAFLLLIFFMSTTQFKQPDPASLNLPSSESKVVVPTSGAVVLTVTRDGRLYIGDESGKAALVPKGQEVDAIVQERAQRPRAYVLVKGDKDADCGTISDLIRSLQESHTLQFDLVAVPGRAGKAGSERKGG